MKAMPDVSVVIPTYRERDNLARLLPALFKVFADARLAGEIVVVDDNSGDGTDQLCRALGVAGTSRLISRLDERGLATAVIRGLQEAQGEICVVMDADFSHPPEEVPVLVAAVRMGDCEMAVGSRYVSGGEVDKNWSLFRRINSRVATLLARGLTDIADPMAGFFAIRKTVFQRTTELRPLGYKIALELIVRCDCRNVVEVPIQFRDRATGESKLSMRQQWLYLRHLGRLYAARYLTRRGMRRQRQESIEPQRRAA